jgi:hypothetical protein
MFIGKLRVLRTCRPACSASAGLFPNGAPLMRRRFTQGKGSSMPGDVFLTANEVAARYRITLRTLHSWVKRGRIDKPIRIKGRRLWKLAELEQSEAFRKELANAPMAEFYRLAKIDITLPWEQFTEQALALLPDLPDFSGEEPETQQDQ